MTTPTPTQVLNELGAEVAVWLTPVEVDGTIGTQSHIAKRSGVSDHAVANILRSLADELDAGMEFETPDPVAPTETDESAPE